MNKDSLLGCRAGYSQMFDLFYLMNKDSLLGCRAGYSQMFDLAHE
jgi:hypothetical protein